MIIPFHRGKWDHRVGSVHEESWHEQVGSPKHQLSNTGGTLAGLFPKGRTSLPHPCPKLQSHTSVTSRTITVHQASV